MANKTFYNEVLTEHNLHPFHRSALENADLVMEGINPSCGDDLWIQLCIKDGRITEGAFQGDGCAISQASADMMLDLVIGKTKDEALRLADLFLRMIKEGITADELEQLEEASVLEDISHMPARVKCAVLAWRTMEAMLKQEQN
ncbi:Fe-S cluster assembly sulfur transfer protein SufU [Eubacterium sp. 1001713B170207_170306_E7]|uniref:Fe-S cluster assembly sulfur transfer protein SufU n=1 Tax=Eubacterium sp. 1001713B170207_170306_E7 TaxID=2787097 RepID=UPI00189B54E3|nr:SUF system NifU family Fe-S cluster assembly protein [Eubacterium sp. 1001713B170207_170306_E7]